MFEIKKTLKISAKYAALPNVSIYLAWKNIKNSNKNNKSNISLPTWNEKFELLQRSQSISNIQDYDPPIRIYVIKQKTGLHSKVKHYVI